MITAPLLPARHELPLIRLQDGKQNKIKERPPAKIPTVKMNRESPMPNSESTPPAKVSRMVAMSKGVDKRSRLEKNPRETPAVSEIEPSTTKNIRLQNDESSMSFLPKPSIEKELEESTRSLERKEAEEDKRSESELSFKLESRNILNIN